MLGFRLGKNYWVGILIGLKDRKCQTPALNILTGDGFNAWWLEVSAANRSSGQILTWGYKVLLTLSWDLDYQSNGE